MSATLAPKGVAPAKPGVEPLETVRDGIASGYGTSIFTNTPIKRDVTGGIIPCTTGADVCIGVFAGCEFDSAGKRFLIPHWPAGQTYDAGTMIAKFTMNPALIFEAQANGPILASQLGEGINLANTSQGSTYTGWSTQALNATTTGATAATFKIVNLALYDDNAWGDAFTRVLVQIGTAQGQVAFGASAEEKEIERRAEEDKRDEERNKQRREADDRDRNERREEDKRRDKDRRDEDKRRADERRDEENRRFEERREEETGGPLPPRMPPPAEIKPSDYAPPGSLPKPGQMVAPGQPTELVERGYDPRAFVAQQEQKRQEQQNAQPNGQQDQSGQQNQSGQQDQQQYADNPLQAPPEQQWPQSEQPR